MESNGAAAVLGDFPGLTKADSEIVRVLEGLLRDARGGTISALGLVVVGGNGALNAMTVGAAPPPVMYMGAGLLQRHVMEAAVKPQGRGTGLLVPRPF